MLCGANIVILASLREGFAPKMVLDAAACIVDLLLVESTKRVRLIFGLKKVV